MCLFHLLVYVNVVDSRVEKHKTFMGIRLKTSYFDDESWLDWGEGGPLWGEGEVTVTVNYRCLSKHHFKATYDSIPLNFELLIICLCSTSAWAAWETEPWVCISVVLLRVCQSECAAHGPVCPSGNPVGALHSLWLNPGLVGFFLFFFFLIAAHSVRMEPDILSMWNKASMQWCGAFPMRSFWRFRLWAHSDIWESFSSWIMWQHVGGNLNIASVITQFPL